MKAAVIHSPGNITCDTVDDPIIKDQNDIILRVTSTAICGSDLHMYSGGIPQARPMVMGHEFMGIVEEVGKNITSLRVGDRVVVPFPISCGSCFFVSTIFPPPANTAIPNITVRKEELLQKKEERFSDTQIFTEGTTADRRST